MLRLLRECDLFRKLPSEHRDPGGDRSPGGEAPESVAGVLVRMLQVVCVAALIFSETRAFLAPVGKQRFDLDMNSFVDAAAPRKMRVLLNITIQDFPCVGLSLDYQDAMGTRAVDVSTTIFKQRLHKNGSAVGETTQNSPNAVSQGAAANPSSVNATGNVTCGHCYGALPDGQCCNTCSDVIYAYRLKRWALPRIETIEQCKHDGSGRPSYQPPQIIHLDDYSSDDYLPKFTRLGSLSQSSQSGSVSTPFRLNFSLEPSAPGTANRTFAPLLLNLSDFLAGISRSTSAPADDAALRELDEDSSGDGEGSNGSAKLMLLWPDCVHMNVIIHGTDVNEALLTDLRPHGATKGCWHDDCSRSDQFTCDKVDGCAGTCRALDACHWWSWGYEFGAPGPKCWLRTGKHQRGKRYGFSSGSRACAPNSTATGPESASSAPAASSSTTPVGAAQASPGRRLMNWDDDYAFPSRPYSFDWGPSLHLPMFGMDSAESKLRREQKGESCRIHGHFDTNKVPGNFHIGTHGVVTPTYLSYFDEPSPPTQNMLHTINQLAFIDLANGTLLNETQPLDGFESPKAFTFQYYLTVNPATVLSPGGGEVHGYQFRSGSFVTNELIGPAVFFRYDIDPIRVTYYTEEVRWSAYLVNVCAVVGGVVAVFSMLAQLAETAMAVAANKE